VLARRQLTLAGGAAAVRRAPLNDAGRRRLAGRDRARVVVAVTTRAGGRAVTRRRALVLPVR
jgi:hypothetical protein